MATFTLLTKGNNGGASTGATASISPATGSWILVWIGCGANAQRLPTSVVGSGVTFAAMNINEGATCSSHGTHHLSECSFLGYASSPSSGALTITANGACSMTWMVLQIQGLDTVNFYNMKGFTNTTSTTWSGSFGYNVEYGPMLAMSGTHHANAMSSVEAGWTHLGYQVFPSITANTHAIGMSYKSTADLGTTMTYNLGSGGGGQYVELNAASILPSAISTSVTLPSGAEVVQGLTSISLDVPVTYGSSTVSYLQPDPTLVPVSFNNPRVFGTGSSEGFVTPISFDSSVTLVDLE